MDKQSADICKETTMKLTANILRRAKALIGSPDKWLHGKAARHGDVLCIGCALGDAYRGEPVYEWMYSLPLREQFARLAGIGFTSGDVIKFNESHSTTHADVMAAFDRAIALAEGRISDEAYTARFISEVVESVKSQEVVEIRSEQ